MLLDPFHLFLKERLLLRKFPYLNLPPCVPIYFSHSAQSSARSLCKYPIKFEENEEKYKPYEY
jgi:hypothetical protein